MRGSVGDAVPMLAQVVEDNPGVSAFRAFLALASVEGDHERAQGMLEEFAAGGFALSPDNTWLTGMVEYAEAAIECRHARAAAGIFRELAPFADDVAFNGATCEGPVSHYLGGLAAVQGRYEEAESYFVQSATLCERMGAKFFGARTDLLWGRMRAERGDPGDTERPHVARSGPFGGGRSGVPHGAASCCGGDPRLEVSNSCGTEVVPASVGAPNAPYSGATIVSGA